MSDQASTKFPYLILGNLSPEKSTHNRNKDFTGKRDAGTGLKLSSVEGQGRSNSSAGDCLSGGGDAIPHPFPDFVTSTTGQHIVHHDVIGGYNKHISLSQMKAILTAQKELRTPVGSLYPSSSQISLIPETDMIYQKYFPNDGNETKKKSSKNAPKKLSVRTGGPSSTANAAIPRSRLEPLNTSVKHAISSSASESNICSVKLNSENPLNQSEGNSVTKSVSNERHNEIKIRDVEAKFRKRVHQQLLTMNTDIERQGTELMEIRKELKELRHVVRRQATEQDSYKCSVDTLSKNLNEVDSKLDLLQETVNGQEKNILAKLMLIGEMSDSDSDFEESGGKDMGATESSSRFIGTTTASKRETTSGVDTFPKQCYNWIPIAPDFDKLLHSVALLNYRMDRNQTMKMCATSNGATFKNADVVDLSLFKNGIVLGSSGFRSYSTMSVIRFVNEIFNGFFPTELSTQYPEGVVIILNDKRSIEYSIESKFNGNGAKLSVKDDPPDLIPGADINSLSRKQSMETVTASATLSTSQISLASARSSCVGAFAGGRGVYEVLPDLTTPDSDYQKTITLKLHIGEFGWRFKFKASTSSTVKAVLDHLEHAFRKKKNEGEDNETPSSSLTLDMILPVPYGRLSCINSTLQEYGITQNTLLYIQERKC